MSTGAVTSYIDVAQLVLYAFWIFFAGLVYYLHRENKREGYPLQSDRSARAPRVPVQGFPPAPEPKTYKLAHGGTSQAPTGKVDQRPVKARPIAGFPGAPLEPEGDPMLANVGPGSYAERADVPDRTAHGAPKIVPLRVAPDHSIAKEDPDPRGMRVYGADGEWAGSVTDIWVDRSEVIVRYFEVELRSEQAGRRVLLPANFANIEGGRRIKVNAILARHFAAVPALKNPDQVTFLEEDRITAYYGAGTLYAEPSRQEPFL
jgi:photosynthetic reaction center H subunit